MDFDGFYDEYIKVLKEESNGLVEVSKTEAFKLFTAIVVAINTYNKGVEDAFKQIIEICK